MRSIAIKLYKSLTDQPDYILSKKRTIFILKAAFSIFVLGYIAFKLIGENLTISDYVTYLSGTGLLWIMVALGGMLLNLGFEAAKWWFMVRKADNSYSFNHAYKAVFAGLSTGIFTPNRIGEYAGRIAFLKPKYRFKAVAYLFVDRVCQMIITIWMGCVAFEYFWHFHQSTVLSLLPISILKVEIFRTLLWSLAIVSPIALIGVQHFAGKISFLQRFSFSKKLTAGFNDLSSLAIFQVIGLGLLRYLTFSFQYYCMLMAFGYTGDFLLAIGMILSVFLIKSIIPSITLTELGIRESVAMVIMGAFAVSSFTAFSSTFFLYMVNIILPSIIGLAFLNRLKV